MSWNFHGTLHMGSEDLGYQMDKIRRRPHRQRVAATFLCGLAVVLVTMGFVHSPHPNATATVTDLGTLASGEKQLHLSYADPVSGEQRDISAAVPPGVSAHDYPAGSTIEVFATTDVGGPIAVIPGTHVLQGLPLGLLALSGASALLLAARRNDRHPPDADRRNYRLIPGPGMGRRPVR